MSKAFTTSPIELRIRWPTFFVSSLSDLLFDMLFGPSEIVTVCWYEMDEKGSISGVWAYLLKVVALLFIPFIKEGKPKWKYYV